MKIGSTEIKHGLFLAPMAGVTDRAFRYMCKKYGAEAMITEMVSAKAICFCDRKTRLLAQIYDDERPCGLQLFGSEPEIMSRAAADVAGRYKPDFIDINMGCPAPKIVNNGEGSSLMKTPQRAYEVVKAVCEAVDIPVTVKMRSGFDENSINAVEIAGLCEKAGASAVFVHARTRSQMYSPGIDMDVIKDVKAALSIPVVGNGDIECGVDALRMLEYTHCDGIMAGRAAMGNPYLFDEIASCLEKREYVPVSTWQKRQDVREHIALLIADKGEFVGVREARKHVAWYIRGVSGAASLRNRVNCAETPEQVFSVIDAAFGTD